MTSGEMTSDSPARRRTEGWSRRVTAQAGGCSQNQRQGAGPPDSLFLLESITGTQVLAGQPRQSSFYLLAQAPSQMSYLHIFSHRLGCLFTFLMAFFEAQRLLILMLKAREKIRSCAKKRQPVSKQRMPEASTQCRTERTQQPTWILQPASPSPEQQGNPNKRGESLPPQNLMKGISNTCTLEQEQVSSDGMSEMQKE